MPAPLFSGFFRSFRDLLKLNDERQGEGGTLASIEWDNTIAFILWQGV